MASPERTSADQGKKRKQRAKRGMGFLASMANSGGSVAPAAPVPSAEGTEDRNKPAVSSFAVDRVLTDDSILDWWRRCSGLHTVEKWVLNYRKHPAGWAALLMIHGIPEVTSRLRSKVESYAIYSALFLSFSIP